MAAGYSATPLIGKLGIRQEMKVMLINAPADYFALLQTDISSQLVINKLKADLIHLFVHSNQEFEANMKKLAPAYKNNTGIIMWVSWHKKASGIQTDVTEDVIRNYALAHGLVDIKVCAVSDVWSGLKLVVPKANR